MRRRQDPLAIVLHLGAHRTASTRLQTVLDANLGATAEEGLIALTPPRRGKRTVPTIREIVKALPPERAGHFNRFLKTRLARASFLRLVADNSPGTALRKVIVSEENLLGPPFDRKTGAGLYPSAHSRLVAFRQVLGHSPAEIHLTLRSYDTFLVSVYASKAVYWPQVPPFDAIRERFLCLSRGWPDLVADVSAAFPGTPLRLTRVEHDPIETRIRHLVGPELLARFRLDGDERPNAAPSVEAIAAAARHGGRISPDDLIDRYAAGARFDPLTESERVTLARRYSEDVAALGLLPATTPSPR